MTMLHRKSFSYRTSDLINATRPGNANVLVFSEGGFWEHEGIGAAAWIAYALGGYWGDRPEDARLIASEVFFC